MEEKIVGFIKSHGPSTEVEVATGIGINSMIASAILSELHSKKKVYQSKKRLGSVRVYYLINQLQEARRKIVKSLEPREVEVLKQFQQKGVILPGDFPEDILQEYGDFLVATTHDGQRAWEWFEGAGKGHIPVREQAPGQRALERLARWRSEVTQVTHPAPAPQKAPERPRPAPEKPKATPQFSRVEASASGPRIVSVPKKAPEISKVKKARAEQTFADSVAHWISGIGGEVSSVEADGKRQWLLDARLPTPLGKQQYLVIAINEKKKRVGVTGVSEAFNKAIREKTPIILVSSTGFAKAAETFWNKEYKGLIALVDGKSLNK